MAQGVVKGRGDRGAAISDPRGPRPSGRADPGRGLSKALQCKPVRPDAAGGFMYAKDIMRRDVVTVAPCLTLTELVRVFQEHAISGAPVVDADGGIVGVVSQTDIVGARREEASVAPPFHLEPDLTVEEFGMHVEESDGTRVEQIMTPGAIAFEEDTPVSALARAMMERHIHRVLITRRGRLAGIVTTMDMLRVAAADKSRARAGTRRGPPASTRKKAAKKRR